MTSPDAAAVTGHLQVKFASIAAVCPVDTFAVATMEEGVVLNNPTVPEGSNQPRMVVEVDSRGTTFGEVGMHLQGKGLAR